MSRLKTTEVIFIVLIVLCLLGMLALVALQLIGIISYLPTFVGLISIALVAAHIGMYADIFLRP